MPLLSKEDRILIKHYREKYNYGARKIVNAFPEKNWHIGTVGKFLRHLRETHGSIEHKSGRGRKRSSRTEENIARVRIVLGNLQPG